MGGGGVGIHTVVESRHLVCGQVGFHTAFVLAWFHMVTCYLSHSPVKELEYCFLDALIKHIFFYIDGKGKQAL